MARKNGPNVSHYLANLNNPNALGDVEDLSFQNDLSSFTTTDFFDFDLADGGIGNMPAPADFDAHQRKQSSAWEHEPLSTEFLGDNFSFPELSEFNDLPTAPNAFSTGSNAFPITSPTSTLSPSAPKTGEKRKLNAISDPAVSGNMDEAARIAAEEDKRRRNTAASARFRIKKKQREQALEKSAKEMTDKAHRLETKVHQLELENKWLKSLITEKNDITKGGFEELYEKFTKGNQEERIPEAMKDGVGTSAHEDEEDDFE
ncbi:hypothetical protein E2P81_ATG01709 [Venturia nashicola]|uniref:BZIP domain-containing protein n=1 Tax=Venturia nashicola TaxID=86259 RepID=A0A4Z1NEM6_9PEZI|nr:hypothetical protein E6O75_ATG01749 [Venturia nashicola]TLD18981.1 hypothetical protein E2P81_ATG01709 [Venturia nashicola]